MDRGVGENECVCVRKRASVGVYLQELILLFMLLFKIRGIFGNMGGE